MLLAPNAWSADGDGTNNPPAPLPRRCLDPDGLDKSLRTALEALKFKVAGGAELKLTEYELSGLGGFINEKALKAFVKAPTNEGLGPTSAAVLISRLNATGLFEQVGSTVDLRPDGAGGHKAVLVINVKPFPVVKHFEFPNVSSKTAQGLLEALLQKPSTSDPAPSPTEKDCPPSEPALAWLAKEDLAKTGVISEGLVLRGLDDALVRVLGRLHRAGYLLTQLDATYDPATGTFKVEVLRDAGTKFVLKGADEGAQKAADRVGRVLANELSNVSPFDLEKLDARLDTIEKRYPFLRRKYGARPEPFRFHLDKTDNAGKSTYTLRARIPKQAELQVAQGIPGTLHPLPFAVASSTETTTFTVPTTPAPEVKPRQVPAYLALDLKPKTGNDLALSDASHGKQVGLVFTRRYVDVDFDWKELLRHTPVTGFGPGVEFRTHFLGLPIPDMKKLWKDETDKKGETDKKDETELWKDQWAHVSLDLGLHANIGRFLEGTRDVPTSAAFDGYAGVTVRLPRNTKRGDRLRIAEAGVQLHDIIDTNDRWRIGALDSYLHSLVLNRPHSDYFRRTGVSSYLTTLINDRAILGMEYRHDEYRDLNPVRPQSIFSLPLPVRRISRDDQVWNSFITRIEWTPTSTSVLDVGTPYRHTDVSLVASRHPLARQTPFHLLMTLENGWPVSSTAEQNLPPKFFRLVIDARGQLTTFKNHSLEYRGRLATGTPRPLYKKDYLGGWSALRGYNYKEFTGDHTFLGTLEYSLPIPLTGFVDLGCGQRTVHSDPTSGALVIPTGPSSTKCVIGAGAAIRLGRRVRFSAAWRADERARLVPEMELFINEYF